MQLDLSLYQRVIHSVDVLCTRGKEIERGRGERGGKKGEGGRGREEGGGRKGEGGRGREEGGGRKGEGGRGREEGRGKRGEGRMGREVWERYSQEYSCRAVLQCLTTHLFITTISCEWSSDRMKQKL